MKQNVQITKIMSKDLITAKHGDKISTVRKVMDDNGIHHLPVVSGKKLIGIVSTPDILRYTFSAAFVSDGSDNDAAIDKAVTLENVMVHDICSIKDTDTVKHAVQLLSTSDYNSLPVIDNEGNLVGIVTSKDIINYLLDQY